MSSMKFRIIVPSDIIAEEEANLVTIPGSKGIFGVMPGHMKLIANIKIGVIKADTNSGTKYYYVHGGVAKVTGEELNIVTEFAEDLKVARSSYIKDKISELNLSKKEHPEDSLEQKIIDDKVAKYESLMKHIGHYDI